MFVLAGVTGVVVRATRDPTPPPAPAAQAPPAPPPAPALPGCLPEGPAVTYEDAPHVLRDVAAATIAASRRVAADGSPMFLPDADGHYPAMWVRDLAYMAEPGPEVLSNEDLAGAFRFLVARQREDGAMPDRVDAAGTPTYLVFGDRPPTDNPSFMVTLAWRHYERTGSTELFAAHAPALAKGLESIPRDPNGLVWIDPAAPHSSYGFTDTVARTGQELFTSLLFAEAAERMGRLYALSDPAASQRWLAEAARVKAALGQLWDPAQGMFLAASQDGRVVDIWGSAYAVASGLVADERAARITAWLRDHQAEYVFRGQIRHLPRGQQWPRLLAGGGTSYQNGGYWSVASGWVAEVLNRVDPAAARAMLAQVATDQRQNGPYEFTADGTTGCGLGAPRYPAAAALPLAATQRIGP